MMYFIERPNTWKAANRKSEELQDYVSRFKNCLIVDELSRDALIQELRSKVKELNDAYPRTKKLKVSFNFNDYISCYSEDRHVDEYVFTINIYPVRKTYRFSEKFVIEKGGES